MAEQRTQLDDVPPATFVAEASTVLRTPADPSIGVPRPREHDVVTLAAGPHIRGNIVEFVVLHDGDVVVLEEQGDADVSPLADAVERYLDPPYRARAIRSTDVFWTVAAIDIELVRMEARGEWIEVAVHDGERTAAVDGAPTRTAFPELERLGERFGESYAVRAERLDGDLWEAKVSPL